MWRRRRRRRRRTTIRRRRLSSLYSWICFLIFFIHSPLRLFLFYSRVPSPSSLLQSCETLGYHEKRNSERSERALKKKHRNREISIGGRSRSPHSFPLFVSVPRCLFAGHLEHITRRSTLCRVLQSQHDSGDSTGFF